MPAPANPDPVTAVWRHCLRLGFKPAVFVALYLLGFLAVVVVMSAPFTQLG